MQKQNKFIFFVIFIFISNVAFGMPFLGGFYSTENDFDKKEFTTNNSLSFFLDVKINRYVKFYTRITTGFEYFANYETPDNNGGAKNFSITVPNFDLMYFEFRTNRQPAETMIEKNANGETNFDLFFFRFGRVLINQGSGFVFSLPGDGFDTAFTLRNFRFRLFAITNSFDYQPFFDFSDSNSKVVFTNWDKKRYPLVSNLSVSENGYFGNYQSFDYNFYFNNEGTDYSDSEKTRLNSLRKAAVIAGRVFSGFNFELIQLVFQNFSLGFLANVDLVPEEFVATYTKRGEFVNNTFGGKYTSFYINFNANGKIWKGLFYNFEGVYETGYNATYYLGSSNDIVIKNELINSFAINTGISYFFDSKLKPTISTSFYYAHGDEDSKIINGVTINKNGQDNNYKSPTQLSVGYAVSPAPDFSNLIIIGLNGTIKPFSYLKNEVFSRFSIENGVLLILRPIIKGPAFLTEKVEYSETGANYNDPVKAYLGTEVDLNFLWQVFSDLSVSLKSGVFVPNYTIYSGNDVYWKVGLGLNISF
jgi:hypothetical protein